MNGVWRRMEQIQIWMLQMKTSLAKVGEDVSGAIPMGDLDYNGVGGRDDINEYEDPEDENDYFLF